MCTVHQTVRSDAGGGHGAGRRAVITELQLQGRCHHWWPRIEQEELQGWMKTGHDKRNQRDIIIRHNYVAVGTGKNIGQGDMRFQGGEGGVEGGSS